MPIYMLLPLVVGVIYLNGKCTSVRCCLCGGEYLLYEGMKEDYANAFIARAGWQMAIMPGLETGICPVCVKGVCV